MRFHVFNVGHGFCAYLVADNGNVVLFDCGHDDEIGFRPSVWLPKNGCGAIELFVITNYDEDHLSDLANLRRALAIGLIRRNKSISAEKLREMKLQGGPLGPGMKELLDMLETYTTPGDLPPFEGIEMTTFHNDYPSFDDTNNLSLVTFVHQGNLGIIIPGDVEKAGWKELLSKKDVRGHLAGVNIFIASHHGREGGYLKEVFDYCIPDIVIISDKEKLYDTQDDQYAKHAKGLPWSTGERRYVLTTRSDGLIKVTKEGDAPYRIVVGR